LLLLFDEEKEIEVVLVEKVEIEDSRPSDGLGEEIWLEEMRLRFWQEWEDHLIERLKELLKEEKCLELIHSQQVCLQLGLIFLFFELAV